MKTITKFKIINWHYFWNETIDVKPIAFLTGPNGSGKSTIIDALLVILLGDTNGKFFNKAAMEKSNRTLKSYLRGEIGDNEDGGFKYLREGRFTSYLAVEFYDDLNETYFTMGCVFDCYEDGSHDHRFFLLENSIPENEFIKDNVPMCYKDLSAYLSNNYPNQYKFFDSNKQYQENLKRKFGGLKDKYFSLLKKSTSFSPITDITTFITEYVCDKQENVDIEAMQQNIFQYKSLESEANLMQSRIDRLEEISEYFSRYQETKTNIKVCSYIIDKVEQQISIDRLTSYKKQVESFKRRLVEIDNELAENDSNKDELSRKKFQLVRDKGDNDTYRITSQLVEERKALEVKINKLNSTKEQVEKDIKTYAETYQNMCKQLLHRLETMNLDILDEDRANDIVEMQDACKNVIRHSERLLATLNEGVSYITEEELSTWRKAVTEFKNLVSALCVSFARTIRNLEQKATNLRHDEDSMAKGVKPYDSALSNIKRELETELYKKYNKNIEVNIFADLIDIDDKSWSNAIEAIMYNQKFNLFVEPKYYFDAYRILRNLLEKYRYFGTALVDQEKIIERNVQPEVGSLAEEILSAHKGATAYTNYLIGRVKKCANIEQARESGNGVTKECDLYRNFTLAKMNPRLYASSYIGTNIGARQIQEKKSEIVELNTVIIKFKEIYNLINSINSLEVINSNEISSILEDISSLTEISGLNKSLDFIKEELSKHDVVEISSIERRIDAIDEDLDKLQKEATALNIEKGNLLSSIDTLVKEKIVNEEKDIKAREERLQASYDAEFINKVGKPTFEQEIEEGHRLFDINSKYTALLSRAQYLSANIFGNIKKLRREYISDYHQSFDVESDNNEEFERELIDIRDVKLPEYREKIQDAYNKATKQFKDDFISKLRNQLESVENQINELNEALASSTFGEDSYYFTCKPNPVYKRYYDMFMDELLLTSGEDDSEFINKYNDVMTDLFNQITTIETNNKHTELAANVERFTDYRTYLDFDLIVTNKEGFKQRLSKMIRKKSGGETQTPFYISVLASFAQLYHVKDKGELGNTIRLMIFDEAFSKMDRSRIRESVKLLRKFGLQAIISAPSEKVGDISELVDETLVVLRNKKSSCVRLYAKED